MACRLVWAASLILALLGAMGTRYRYLRWYLCVSIWVAPLYWPEVTGWYDQFWPVVAVICALRLCATVEAIWLQTDGLPMRAQLIAGAGTCGIFACAVMWSGHYAQVRDIAVYLCQHARVWAACVSIVVAGALWVAGLWRGRPEDRIAAAVGIMALAHGVTSGIWLCCPEWAWEHLDVPSTLVDAGALFWLSIALTATQARTDAGRYPRAPQISQ
jgi:hypothetical protein